VVTINRPDKRKCPELKTREEGAALLDELRNDASIRVVISPARATRHLSQAPTLPNLPGAQR